MTQNENSSEWAPLLACASRIAQTEFEPRANEADRAAGPPKENITRLAEVGLLGLTAPRRYGGYEAPADVFYAYTETLASACGLTTFVQGQHLSACSLVDRSTNEELQHTLLPAWSRAERLCGIAFSHVRRPGTPVLRARIEAQNVVFDGEAPWFTGWGIMDDVVIAGTLSDGRYLYAAGPVRDWPGISASEPMALCAMNASGTVTLHCKNYRLPASRILKVITPTEMAATDDAAILMVTAQPLGVMRACAALIGGLARDRNDPLLLEAAQRLERQREDLRERIGVLRATEGGPEVREEALRLRAEAIELGVRTAHAALAAAGGRGNALDHTAQRLFREAMFYSLTAQTPAVRAATVRRLARIEENIREPPLSQ